MDFDNAVQRDNLGMYSTKLYPESPYIPMEDAFSSSSSSSNGSSRILMNNLDHFMVETPLASLYYSSFYDPFDPFQANSVGRNSQEFSHVWGDGGLINHGRRFLDVGNGDSSSGTGFRGMDHRYNQMSELKGFDEKDSCLNDDGDQATNDRGKAQNKRKRIVDKKSEIIKGQWTREEDGLLVELVEKHGIRKWSSIAQMLPGRIGKQCRERWHNHLKPNIKKDRWSEEEDRILIEVHRQLGNRWAEIARSLPGRSENTIKNHWNATKRRQLSSRRNSNANTPLQNYIRSVMADDAKGTSDNSPSKLDGCSKEEEETTSLETQMHVQFDIQKEMDFMEMLSYGYI